MAEVEVRSGWVVVWSRNWSDGTKHIGHGQWELSPLMSAITHLY